MITKATTWWKGYRQGQKHLKEWEEEQPFRVKVVSRPITMKFDIILAVVIVATWLPLAFISKSPDRFGIGFLCGYMAVSAWNHHHQARQVIQLGELITRMERHLPSRGLDSLEQITHGDPTIISTIHSKPDSSGQWRSVAWFEADTTAFLKAPFTDVEDRTR